VGLNYTVITSISKECFLPSRSNPNEFKQRVESGFDRLRPYFTGIIINAGWSSVRAGLTSMQDIALRKDEENGE
jgi:hypothetical protein